MELSVFQKRSLAAAVLLSLCAPALAAEDEGPVTATIGGRLRLIEPGFVQSAAQEQLLHELETNLLIRAPEL